MVVDLPDFAQDSSVQRRPHRIGSRIGSAANHNDLLYRAMARLQAQYPQLHLIPVKLDPLFETDLAIERMEPVVPLIEVYAQATPGMSGCLADPVSCIDMPRFLFNNRFGFIFWDVVHPTTEAHDYLGDYMYNLLASEYE